MVSLAAETERAVRRFHELFNLDVDGMVGVNTWNKLFEVSKAIQQGSRPSPTFPTFPGTLLQSGSRGTDVRLIQERLNFIAMYYKNIPTIVGRRHLWTAHHEFSKSLPNHAGTQCRWHCRLTDMG